MKDLFKFPLILTNRLSYNSLSKILGIPLWPKSWATVGQIEKQKQTKIDRVYGVYLEVCPSIQIETFWITLYFYLFRMLENHQIKDEIFLDIANT